MAITLHCQCGKMLQVDEKYRGKKAQCPACKTLLVVDDAPPDLAPATIVTETPAPATAIEAPKPIKSIKSTKPAPAPAAPPIDPANPFAVPADSASSSSPVRKKRRSMKPWIAGAGCALLVAFSCCSGIGTGVWYFFLRGPDEDLRFVHADVAAFYSLRMGDLLKSQAVKDQFALLPLGEKEKFDKKLGEMEKKLGLSLADVERATIITRSVDLRDTGTVLRTSKPMSKKKIFTTFSSDKTDKKHNDKVYHLLERDGKVHMVLHFHSDTIVLQTDNEKAMIDFLSNYGKPATDPALQRGVKYASSGSYAVVAAFNQRMTNMMLAGDGAGINIPEINGIVVTATAQDRLNFEGIGLFPTRDAAINAKSTLDTARQKFERDFAKGGGGGDAAAVRKILDSLTITQSGAEVTVRGKSDAPIFRLLDTVRHLDLKPPAQNASRKNLQTIHQALSLYEGQHGKYPPPTGKAGLSWRVHILPQIDGKNALSDQINMSEPWDSKHNSKFWNKMPKVYQLPGKPSTENTYYQVFRGEVSAFPPDKAVRRDDISDGLEQTIFVIEAADPINWMKPDDIPMKPDSRQTSLKLVGNHWGDDSFLALFGDGAVRRMPRSLQAGTLYGMITREGRENIDARKFGDDDGGRPDIDDEP